ncbi:MAG: tRNA (adenosine(37)-N6)-threonylcarbamoyltransferase complex dimerization subunit type 1 TsaB [Polyangiaceae bacterium]
MKILAFTTATPRCSVVVVDGDQQLAGGGYDDEMRHAERLFGVVDEVLAAAKIRRDDIEAIACDVGPGSFTGVRVGLASAKGMAMGLEIPLIGVCGLAAMADAARQMCPEGVIVPVTDGKRSELFFAAYDAQGAEVLSPRSLRAEQLRAALAEFGQDVVLCGDVLDTLDDLGQRRVEAAGAAFPDARYIARLALREMAAGGVVSLADVQPVYARAPDAIPQGAPGHGTRGGRTKS